MAVIKARGCNMPISNESFNAGVSNSKLLEFFMNNPNQAYSSEELIEQFGDVRIELDILQIKDIIEAKAIINTEGIPDDIYFRLRRKKP
jgi:hypothetical protein